MENTSNNNREEALRVKDIAVEKMKNHDFRSAQQIILKAQNLCPELENLPQIFAISNVHCAAESMVRGQKDLYGILQVEETADQKTITKQYRKIAFLVHPDKNKFTGAAEAIKLVNEAYSVLSDPERRTQHNNKRKETDPNKGNVPAGSGPKFWTICPLCQYRYQYFQRALNKKVICQTCREKLGTYQAEEPETMPTPSQQVYPAMSSCASKEGYMSAGAVEKSNKSEVLKRKFIISETDENVGASSMTDRTDSNVAKRSAANEGDVPTGSGPTFWTKCPHCEYRFEYFLRALNKKVICQECTESFRAYREEEPEPMPTSSTVHCIPPVPANIFPERQHDTPSQQVHPAKSSCASKEGYMSAGVVEKYNKSEMVKRKFIVSETDENILASSMIDPTDSNVGHKNKLAKRYADSGSGIKISDINRITYGDGGNDQIWALYDEIDHMPRLYAKLTCAGQSKYFHMLKYHPSTREQKKWNAKGLPVACGRFSCGEKVDILEYKAMYSHSVEAKKINVKKASGGKGYVKNKITVYEIFPKVGEVWAVYKGWSIQWSSNTEKNRSFEYQVVQILQDMSESGGTNVIPLVRIKDFSTLLVTAQDKSAFHIPSREIFRYSHRIPHYRVTGSENSLKKINGLPLEKDVSVPEGFLVLDSQCLPSDLAAALPSISLDTYMSQRKKGQFEVSPQVGEIWAIYIDWAPEWTPSSTGCELAVGEIIERNDASIKLSFLAKVDGHTSVFKPDKKKGVLEIPTGEYLRFSHHIPASFRVTKEKGGKFRIFYDLDPASLTAVFVTTSTPSATAVHPTATAHTQEKKCPTDDVRRSLRERQPNTRVRGPGWVQ